MDMKPPIFVRKLSTQERKALEDGLQSSNAFVLRRCQILLASARGEIAPRIAENLGCGEQTVRNAIHEFNEKGLKSLTPGSSRPKEVHAAFDEERAEALRELLQRSPRGSLAKRAASGRWRTLCAHQSFEQGLTNKRVSGETIRATLKRLGVRWEKAKRWIESPDAEYERKKGLSRG
jgi:transposase